MPTSTECPNPKCEDGYIGNPAVICQDCLHGGRIPPERLKPVEVLGRFSYEGEDRAIWIGDPAKRPVGSSGKVRDIGRDGGVWVDWGRDPDTGEVAEGWTMPELLLTPREAGERGMEPWAKVFSGTAKPLSGPRPSIFL